MYKKTSICSKKRLVGCGNNSSPQGLQGEEIHIYGRIVAIADVFDALISPRCYKKLWDPERVFAYFKEHAGSQFDPHLAQLLLDNFTQAQAIVMKFHE